MTEIEDLRVIVLLGVFNSRFKVILSRDSIFPIIFLVNILTRENSITQIFQKLDFGLLLIFKKLLTECKRSHSHT